MYGWSTCNIKVNVTMAASEALIWAVLVWMPDRALHGTPQATSLRPLVTAIMQCLMLTHYRMY